MLETSTTTSSQKTADNNNDRTSKSRALRPDKDAINKYRFEAAMEKSAREKSSTPEQKHAVTNQHQEQLASGNGQQDLGSMSASIAQYRYKFALEKSKQQEQQELRARIAALPENSDAFVSALCRGGSEKIKMVFSQLDPNDIGSREVLCSQLLLMRNSLIFADTIIEALSKIDRTDPARSEVARALNSFIRSLHGKEEMRCFRRLSEKAQTLLDDISVNKC